jgi:hypothetical protein
VLAFGVDEIFMQWNPMRLISMKVIVFSIILVCFVLENTLTSSNCDWSISQQREQYKKLTPPPTGCKNFVLMQERNNRKDIYEGKFQYTWVGYELDARLIAIKYKLYTLNGYSAQRPAGWYKMALPPIPDCPGYIDGVASWCKQNNLDVTKIFAYDPISNKWFSNIYEALNQ